MLSILLGLIKYETKEDTSFTPLPQRRATVNIWVQFLPTKRQTLEEKIGWPISVFLQYNLNVSPFSRKLAPSLPSGFSASAAA